MDAQALVERYLSEVSNEPDRDRRRAAIEAMFDAAVRYVDQDGAVEGRAAFIRRIDELAAMMAPGARFSSARPVRTADDAVLFHWRLGLPGEEPMLTGSDVALVDDGRIVRLYAFLD